MDQLPQWFTVKGAAKPPGGEHVIKALLAVQVITNGAGGYEFEAVVMLPSLIGLGIVIYLSSN